MKRKMSQSMTMTFQRRGLFSGLLRALGLVLGLGFAAAVLSPPAFAATPAETFVDDNIHKGLEILNSKSLPVDQRRSQFEGFLLGLTDMKRIADFTLGQYRRGATPADLAAFDAAFQNYAVAVYQSYFARYAGQTLKVTNSVERAPGDFIVSTQLIDPNDHSGQPPLQVDFRVSTSSGKPVVIDFSVSGIWLALEERDQFTSFLGQNGGNIQMLNSHLNDLAKQYK
jgi:phospholipid transport system substrate-binding protein